jgi:hypothetical protein
MDRSLYEGRIVNIDGSGDSGFPAVNTSDPVKVILERLEDMYSSGELVWPEGVPAGEIWLKVVGDKGDGVSKLGYQIVNAKTPNSAANTPLLSTFYGPDTYINMKECFGIYSAVFSQLNAMRFRNFKIVVFIAGDCEFLARVFGLSSASSKHPCFFCSISTTDLKIPPNLRAEIPTPRSLSSISQMYAKFRDDGGNSNRQKHFQNCIHEPIFSIPISHIVPPWLHVTLGLVQRMHDSLVARISKYPLASGKIIAHFEKILHSKGIDRQTYFSQCLHGNACHLYLLNVRDMYASLREFIAWNVSYAEMSERELQKLCIIVRRYEALFSLYAEVDNMVASNILMGDGPTIARVVRRFMRLYRKLRISVCLKTHILENHIVDFVNTHGVSLGLMGEQGIESTHYGFKYVKERRTRNLVVKLLEKTRRYSIKTRVRMPMP